LGTRLIAYTGKGGVGKSIISCTTGLRSAELGYDTLVISSDPSHTLSDVFEVPVKGDEIKVAERLWVVHTDPVNEAMKHYSALMDYIAELFKVRDVDESLAYELASFPGSTGTAALLKAHEYYSQKRFDVLVMDMVPSGEALRLLYMPYLISHFSRRLIKLIAPAVQLGRIVEPITRMPLPSSEAIDKQVELLERMEAVRRFLIDYDVTSMRLVMNPDRFSIVNARRTYMQSSLYGLNTDIAIVNKVLPSEVQDPYLDNWKHTQEDYINQVRVDFDPLPVKTLPLYGEELKGLRALSKASRDLFKDEDPTQVYHRGQPLEVIPRKDGVDMVLTAHKARREDVQVERIGDELIIHLYTDVGSTRILIPLPAITFKYRLKGAKLINGRLNIKFGV